MPEKRINTELVEIKDTRKRKELTITAEKNDSFKLLLSDTAEAIRDAGVKTEQDREAGLYVQIGIAL